VIDRVNYHANSPAISLQQSTIGFTVEAGDFINLGEFGFQKSGFAYIGNTGIGLDEDLAEYPGIATRPIKSDNVTTSFSYEKTGSRIEGCGFLTK
jgi:hypothetical protein